MAYNKHLRNSYDIGDIIGGGAFSVVKTGVNLLNNDRVAIKVMKKGDNSHDSNSTVLQEVSILKSLNHKNIIGFRDFFEESDNFYIVMEYLDGNGLQLKLIKTMKSVKCNY